MATEEKNGKLQDRIELAENLLKRSEMLEEDGLFGSTKLTNRIRSELRFLLKIKNGKIEFKDDHLNSTNLTSLEALVKVTEKTKNKIGILQNFYLRDELDDFEENKPVCVDIVCENGSAWVKVIARNAKALLTAWEGRGAYGEKSIIDQAGRFLAVADCNPCNFHPPKVHFIFCKGVHSSLAEEMGKMGVRVEGYRLDSEEGRLEEGAQTNQYCYRLGLEIKSQTFDINRVNLDVTALLCLVSNLCHGHNNYEFNIPVLSKQASDERRCRVLPAVEDYIDDKKLFVCETAFRSFKSIVDTVGGPLERERSEKLSEKIIVVKDQPSERAMGLKTSGKINERSKIIFGTGDSLKAVTVTANTGFVRAAMQNGIRFSVFEHEARALTEIKEGGAKILKAESCSQWQGC